VKPYYDDGQVTLYCGDCRELLPRLGVDPELVVTDPPYPAYERERWGVAWEVPDAAAVLRATKAPSILCFWPPRLAPPLPEPVVEHIWHKPNAGVAAHQYERILGYGTVRRRCRVYRMAAILPNYTQFAREAVGHPTQKPLRLLRLVLADQPGGLVLDPFAGSGTTLRAAKDLGRRAIGIEVDPAYCEMTVRRLAQLALPLEAA
jgi:site-specific DNA-methyltransferase (adenine-specific)